MSCRPQFLLSSFVTVVLLCAYPALCADFTVDSGRQASTVKLVPAADEPSPRHSVSREARDKLIVEGLGLVPLGRPWVVTYKVLDFGREIGLAAVDLETRAMEARLVLISADAGELKGLHAHGTTLATDPKALAALARLRTHVTENASGPYGFMGRALVNQAPYALAEIGMDRAIGAAIGKLAGGIAASLSLGDYVQYLGRNRGTIGTGLRLVGWTKLGERARAASGYTDKLTKSLVEVALGEFVVGKAKEALTEESAAVLKRILEENPSQKVTTGGGRRARLELALRPAAALPALAVAVQAVRPTADPVSVYRDPVATAISVDDSFIRSSSRDSAGPAVRAEPAPARPETSDANSCWKRHCLGGDLDRLKLPKDQKHSEPDFDRRKSKK